MNLAISILKVLAGQPHGSLPTKELSRQVAFLASSGREWDERVRRLASNVPDLDIFAARHVICENHMWQITNSGRDLLALLEVSGRISDTVDQHNERAAAIARAA